MIQKEIKHRGIINPKQQLGKKKSKKKIKIKFKDV
jgi:hypothetical protein